MRVTIWDIDYYYSNNKKNAFNPILMKLSSYHKQLGDSVILVETEYDINRPYDIYYICREKKDAPQPPAAFFLDRNIRWIGKANKTREWKIPDVVYACRPDYLLYPEKNTTWERSEQIRLLDSNGKLMPLIQDWDNVFKNKRVLVTDTMLWTTASEITKNALKTLAPIKNLTFLEPIWIQKILSDKDIRELFLNLNLGYGSNIRFMPMFLGEYDEARLLIEEMRSKWPTLGIGALPLKLKPSTHWEDKENALKEFAEVKRIIVNAKKNGIAIKIVPLKERLDTPYFGVFEALSDWMDKMPQRSWLEFISMSIGHAPFGQVEEFWRHPSRWNEYFRDLLRQTYMDKEFLLTVWKEKKLSENDIPWTLWDKEFQLGL